MRKYRLKIRVLIGCIVILILGVDSILKSISIKDNMINIICSVVLLLIVICAFFTCFYANIIIHENSIFFRTFLKRKEILFSDVKSIKQREDPIATKIFKAVVYSDNEEIEISAIYHNYKELVQLVVDKCDEGVFIESNIYEHLATQK